MYIKTFHKDQYVEYIKSSSLSQNSIRFISSDINIFIKWLHNFGSKNISFESLLNEFILDQLNLRVSGNTLSRRKSSVKSFLSWFSDNFATEIAPKIHKENDASRYLSKVTGQAPANIQPNSNGDVAYFDKSSSYMPDYSQKLTNKPIRNLKMIKFFIITAILGVSAVLLIINIQMGGASASFLSTSNSDVLGVDDSNRVISTKELTITVTVANLTTKPNIVAIKFIDLNSNFSDVKKTYNCRFEFKKIKAQQSLIYISPLKNCGLEKNIYNYLITKQSFGFDLFIDDIKVNTSPIYLSIDKNSSIKDLEPSRDDLSASIDDINRKLNLLTGQFINNSNQLSLYDTFSIRDIRNKNFDIELQDGTVIRYHDLEYGPSALGDFVGIKKGEYLMSTGIIDVLYDSKAKISYGEELELSSEPGFLTKKGLGTLVNGKILYSLDSADASSTPKLIKALIK